MSAAERYAALERAFAGVRSPFALVDLEALRANAAEMLARARGKPLRVASKSVRSRPLLELILALDPQVRGLMTFTLAESLWLARLGFGDLLLAYPTSDREGLVKLAGLDLERAPIVMVDSLEQLDLIRSCARGGRVRVCIDLDAGLPVAGGRLRIGPKRSPLHRADQAVALAREIAAREELELSGLMAYEGQIAGIGDRPRGRRLRGLAIGAMQRRSARDISERRAATVAAVSEVAPLPLVNGGGTGSLHTTGLEAVVTEVTAGSGFFAPRLFDEYSAFRLRPAALFALPVVRRPGPRLATVLGGGYPASGPAGRDRLPWPELPAGLSLLGEEGAGEVQTPVRGAAAAALAIGDNVYFRHAKAGELCERFAELHLLDGGEVVDVVPTYRGEGKTFL